jgi:hypothetical protein
MKDWNAQCSALVRTAGQRDVRNAILLRDTVSHLGMVRATRRFHAGETVFRNGPVTLSPDAYVQSARRQIGD